MQCSFHDFMKQVAARRLASGYLLVGAESLWIEEALTALRDALLTDDFTATRSAEDMQESRESRIASPASDDARRAIESFDYTRYQGRESEVDQILMQVRTPPFMARRRLVIVKDFDQYRKEGQQKLLEELNKESPVCRLVLTAGALDKTLERLVATCDCPRFLVVIPAADRTEASEFIDRWSRRNRIPVTDDARQLLLEVSAEGASETSLSLLRNELDKLQTFLGESYHQDTKAPGNESLGQSQTTAPGSAQQATVSRETVRDLCGRWREYQVGEFVDAVLQRNRRLALNNLRHLDHWNEPPVKIVAWLAGRFLRMLAYGFGEARYWTKPEMTAALRSLAAIDIRLKRGSPEPYYLLESFVLRRTGTARRAA